MGIGSHTSPNVGASSHWQTPPEIIEALGPFDFDPCPLGAFSADGLQIPGHGYVWLNPPYSAEMWPWLYKLADYGNGIALIFARTETAGFFNTVWSRASALLFLKGRLHFYKDGQRAKGNSGGPSVLVAYGAFAAKRLQECQLAGAYVEHQLLKKAP